MKTLSLLVFGIILLTLGISWAPTGTQELFYLYLTLLVVIPFTILVISEFLRMVVNYIRLVRSK